MSIRHLDRMFQPRSVAVIGASDKPHRIGTRVLANLLQAQAAAGLGASARAIWPLNPRHQNLQGLPCYARVSALPSAPELAILCTPPATIPNLIAELGARGTRAAIVMTAGLEQIHSGGRNLQQAMLAAAKRHQVRILGPGSVGLQTPALGLNASFTHIPASAGKLAFVAQSGALGTAMLDWASLHGIGFSRFLTMGETADVDFGDLLDYLAADSATEAILLCIEQVCCARKFMSAGRLAARGKPVIVLKVGRDAEPGADLVFDAAIRRAGMLRVQSIEDLFDAVETLARQRPQRGERLAVLSNGVGLGLIAADALAAGGAQLAPLSAESQLLLRRTCAQPTNPVALLADVPVAHYQAAVEALLHETNADALLFLHAPTAMVDSQQIATAIAPLLRGASKNVLSCWLGGSAVAAARQVFAEAGLPTYDTPEKAVHGFLQIAQYRRNQDLLMEVPAQLAATSAPERAAAQALVAAAQSSGQTRLSDTDLRSLLATYGIALATPQQAALAGTTLAAARIEIATDAVFGPVLYFGQGGLAAEVAADRAAGLPPLNMVLARDMVSRTRVARLLQQAQTAADAEALCRTLVQVADMVADLPQLAALDLNPLLVLGGSVVALGAQLALGPARSHRAMAIRPYPQELEQALDWGGGKILLRPIRPEDAPQHQVFFAALDPDDVRLRFFTAMRELPPGQLARLTQIDYDRAMAFIATRTGADGAPETLGVVRAIADADNQAAEFAIIIRSDLKGQGLGYILFQKLVDYFRSHGTAQIVGDALAENLGVQKLVRHFGGSVLPHPETGLVRLQLPLR
ncbi:GNAT family N-acetyltransferase [Duganella fentianensis]|uniref:bifunctional acetate--CoA ligase family protein/GNAT family N-acetyltransferase n=1 Tax=Duganella fentianensis TaxID=2692177 RepID=UPI0032B1C266